MTGDDKLKTSCCVECDKKVLVVRGKPGDDGHPLDPITAYFECENCGLRAMQYYRLELSPDRRSLVLPHGVELPCDFIDQDVDPSKTWIGNFPSTGEWQIYIVEQEPPDHYGDNGNDHQ